MGDIEAAEIAAGLAVKATFEMAGAPVDPDHHAGVLDAPTTEDPFDHRLIVRERDQALARALRTIGERCQALLRMLASPEPPSYEEIGAALGMPIGAIGPTRARCLDKLRRSPELAGIELR